jgi:hypothetical protein
MAKLVLTNPVITVNSVTLSDHIASVSVDVKLDEVETTAFGSAGKERIAGLQDSQITLAFHQDFASSSVEATLWPLLGATTTVTVKATSAATSATNPLYSATVLVSDWQPITGKVGELLSPSITWKVSGAVTRSTT